MDVLNYFQADSRISNFDTIWIESDKFHVWHAGHTKGCELNPVGNDEFLYTVCVCIEWVAMIFSRDLPNPGIELGYSCTVGRFFAIWATREAPHEFWEDTFSV